MNVPENNADGFFKKYHEETKEYQKECLIAGAIKFTNFVHSATLEQLKDELASYKKQYRALYLPMMTAIAEAAEATKSTTIAEQDESVGNAMVKFSALYGVKEIVDRTVILEKEISKREVH